MTCRATSSRSDPGYSSLLLTGQEKRKTPLNHRPFHCIQQLGDTRRRPDSPRREAFGADAYPITEIGKLARLREHRADALECNVSRVQLNIAWLRLLRPVLLVLVSLACSAQGGQLPCACAFALSSSQDRSWESHGHAPWMILTE